MSRGRRRPDAQSTAQRLVAAEPDHSVRGSAHVGDPYDPQQVVGMGVRLFAIWLALIGLDKLGGYFTTLARPGWKEPAEYLLVVPLLYWLVAALLWFFPMSVAHRLVPKTRFENVLSFAPLELARVGTALLGLWLLATSMPWLATVLVRVVAFPAPGGSFFSELSPDERLYLLQETLRIIVGIALVFGSASIAQRVVAETNAGRDHEGQSKNL